MAGLEKEPAEAAPMVISASALCPCEMCEDERAYERTFTDRTNMEEQLPTWENSTKLSLPSWWRTTTGTDIERTAPKVEEYGLKDLAVMGQVFAAETEIPLEDYQAAIWACLFYAQGKLARALAALQRGEDPSEDTLFDLSVYAMFTRRFLEDKEL